MSFTRIHDAQTKVGDETLSLLVYADESASFAIFHGNEVQSMRSLDPHEDGSDIAICGEAKEWFDRELAMGRKKTKDGES